MTVYTFQSNDYSYICKRTIKKSMMKNKATTILLTLSLSLQGFSQSHNNPFGNPLVPDMIADASIELIGDTFYCYATTDGYGRGLETSGPPVVWKSKDFKHWSFDGICFPSAAKEKFWAPSKAIERNGRWYLYPTMNGYMHVAVSDSPDGPFHLARGEDVFDKPYSKASTLIQTGDRGGIDAEIFVDDDGQAYAFWGQRHVARLADDMVTIGEIQTLETRRKEYSEGPIFFKRKGIYYYLYTIGGDENYKYYYMMSRISPLGPYETPEHDLVSITDVEKGVFGPGHGCVFNDGDNYYFAFLEFSRNSTNRQTYVNRMEFNDDGTIEISDEDLEITTHKSSGAGGQHINKTESAVRIVHIPTGIVVGCQTERSQLQNKEMALKMLKSKLMEIKMREHLEKVEDIQGVKADIEWGSQIRSYVFMPYTLVKDTRTGYEETNVDAVMDGSIDGFINAYLKANA